MECTSRGMESVVATVSGYHGLERFNLIKLISQAGANYVGKMTTSTTHLVCWKFEGSKYKFAKKFKITIVNHRWVEECIKKGKRVAEHPFTLESGQEVGPLSLEVPVINELGNLDKVKKPFSDKSNISNSSARVIDHVGREDCDLNAWTNSTKLNEVRKSDGSSYKLKSSEIRKIYDWKDQPGCLNAPFPDLMRLEHVEWAAGTSRHSTGEKNKVSINKKSGTSLNKISERGKGEFDGTRRTRDGTHKRRRLVKISARNDNLETLVLDSDEEGDSTTVQGQSDQTTAMLEHNSCGGKHEAGTISLSSDEGSNHEDLDDIAEISNPNHVHAMNSNSCLQETSSTPERVEGHSTAENLNGKSNSGSPNETVTRSPASKELSCVICWTKFSSTRGVLPCGHRFCYKCIKSWADHMTASKKAPSCPLCKANFFTINKVEDAATSDQKIFSQTIPCASSTVEIFRAANQDRNITGAEFSFSNICSRCRCWEPEEFLIRCHVCTSVSIHQYCLDPPLLPWACARCEGLQRLFHNSY